MSDEWTFVWTGERIPRKKGSPNEVLQPSQPYMGRHCLPSSQTLFPHLFVIGLNYVRKNYEGR